MSTRFDLLKVSRFILKALIILNIAAAALCVVAVIASFPLGDAFLTEARKNTPGIDAAEMLSLVRLLGGAAALVSVIIHVLLKQLYGIVESVRDGTPFIAENARRLRIAAWALLAFNVADLWFGYVGLTFAADTGEIVSWAPSFSGWLAVLLLFVLARVFTVGAAMQDDLDGTV